MTESDQWWGKQFELQARADVVWLLKAEGLKRAADILYSVYEQASTQLRELARRPVSEGENSSRPATEEEVGLVLDTKLGPVWQMLMGFAIENLAKGILVGISVANSSSPVDAKGSFKFGSKSHNLSELLEKCISLNDRERRVLRGLTTYVKWGGRYPIPIRRSQMFDDVRVEPGPGGSVVPRGPEYDRLAHDAVADIYGRLHGLLSTMYAARMVKRDSTL